MKRIAKYRQSEFLVEPNNALESEFWEKFTNEKWEKTTLDFLLGNLRAGHFLDIGSWIGPVSLLMSRHYQKVIAVDFDYVANKSFTNNISLNKIENIQHYSIGLGDEEKTVEIDGDNLGQSTTNVFSKHSVNKIKIKLTTFKKFIHGLPEKELINFIKIDCEGAEYLFLDEVYEYMKNRKLMVTISYHPWVISKPRYYFVKFHHWLRQLQFKRYYFTKEGTIIVKAPWSPLISLYDRFPMADAIES
jgi:FkbM family methyltransferase